MPTTRLIVAVHGATGSQGAPVVRALVRAGHGVRALSRTAAPLRDATAVQADFDDLDSLTTAYADTDVVVIQLPLEFAAGRAVAQAENAAEAIARAGVRRVVVSAGGPIPPVSVGVPYLDARTTLVARLADGPAATLAFSPAGAYAENLLLPGSLARIAGGELAYPVPAELPMPWLATDDLAAQIAGAVTSEERGALVVAGPQTLSGPEAAEAVGAAADLPLRWTTITPDEYERMLAPTIGPDAAAGIAGFYAALADGPPPAPDPATVRVGPTTLREWAQRQDWASQSA